MWKNYDEEKPRKEGLYLVEICSPGEFSSGYDLRKYKRQIETKRIYLEEYKQYVEVNVSSGDLAIDTYGNEYVERWMEIPR